MAEATTLRVIVLEDYESMSRKAASVVARQVRKKPSSVLGLATGSTPVGLYRELVRLHRLEGLDFSRVTTFNLDEYFGIGSNDPRSYHHFMDEHLFRQVNVPAENIHIPDGETKDPAEECRRYEAEIERSGGIDLQVLGIGRNGHIGFNEPGAELGGTTRLVRLAEQTVKINAGAAHTAVPKLAISMGIKTIMRSRRILLLACGSAKAEMVALAAQGPVTPAVPASILQLHPDVVLLLDREAAALLTASPRPSVATPSLKTGITEVPLS
jgi:glucosamine-6-phosphate deaminase